jgi:hypothetical protein
MRVEVVALATPARALAALQRIQRAGWPASMASINVWMLHPLGEAGRR